MDYQTINILNIIVLFLTFGAIIWYSVETRGMKNQMVLQNRLQLRPIIIFVFMEKKYACLLPQNINKSYKGERIFRCFLSQNSYPLALNIKIEAVNIKNSAKNQILFTSAAVGGNWDEFIDSEDLNLDEYSYFISYSDIAGNNYQTIYRKDTHGQWELIFR